MSGRLPPASPIGRDRPVRPLRPEMSQARSGFNLMLPRRSFEGATKLVPGTGFLPAAMLLACCLGARLLGADVPATEYPRSGGTFSLYVENDSIAGTDRNYTSGVKIGWSSPDLSSFRDTPASILFRPVLEGLPVVNRPEYQKNLLLALGQNIYTPNDTKATALIADDRPYAGWLYAGVGVVWKNAKVRNSIVFDLGVVGSWSFAQDSQRLVHDIINSGHPEGWANQLHNEFGFVGTYERTWRWPRHARRDGLDWELLPHAGMALGNVATYANIGGEIRFGLNLPDDFGTSAISPSAVTSTPVDGAMGSGGADGAFGVHAFARADGRAVAHNIFIDGNTFGDSPSVGHKVLVADLSVGLALNYRNTELAFAIVDRTREFDGQKENQVFGTISLNITY